MTGENFRIYRQSDEKARQGRDGIALCYGEIPLPRTRLPFAARGFPARGADIR